MSRDKIVGQLLTVQSIDDYTLTATLQDGQEIKIYASAEGTMELTTSREESAAEELRAERLAKRAL